MIDMSHTVNRNDDVLVYFDSWFEAFQELEKEGAHRGVLNSMNIDKPHRRRKKGERVVHPAGSWGRDRESGARLFTPIPDVKSLVFLNGDEYYTGCPSIHESTKHPGKWYIRYPK